jgi:glycosyltransferase involved in cell wall biosynthesis
MTKKIINILFNDFNIDIRALKISRSLQANGYEVTLVATHFDKTLPKEEIIEGFEVKRFNVGKIKFLPLNLILFWFIVIKNYRKENIFHCNDLYALPPAYVIKKFFNKDAKIVYDCHEHETEAQIYSGKPILKFFARVFEKLMIGSADEILVVSESIKEEYEEMYDIDEPTLIMNCPYYKEYGEKDLFRKELNIAEEKTIFLYQGKYQPGKGVESLIDIFKKTIKTNRDIVLILLTYGKNIDRLKSIISDSDNIYWHDKVSPDIYMNYVASADWGVHFMENTCKNHDYAMPNKLFDYFMGGLPVIVSNLKEMSNFVKKNEVGYVIDLEQPNEAVDIIKNINKNTKEKFINNVEKVAKEYTWEEQEKVLLNIYNSL